MWFSVLKLLQAIRPGAGEEKPGLGAAEACVYGDSLGPSCEMANHFTWFSNGFVMKPPLCFTNKIEYKCLIDQTGERATSLTETEWGTHGAT